MLVVPSMAARCECGGAGGGGCGVSVRTLRTAQWTRASSKFVGMYLDACAGP